MHSLCRRLRAALVAAVLLLSAAAPARAQTADSEQLGRAIDYFQSGKYHEARLILQRLDGRYRLNPRFRAYLGVCHYYAWAYAEAAACLDSVIPRLSAFAPQERSFYCYADAYDREGFIYMYREDWIAALDHFQNALVYYRRYRPEETARVAQIRNMIQGCCEKIKNKHG